MVSQGVKPQEKVFVEGHGCSASLADTEILRGIIEQGGYKLVEDEREADVGVLVTCSVKSVTEQRMLSRIAELSGDGSKKLIVAGCLPKADPGKILRINSNLSMVGPGNLDSIIAAIELTQPGSQLIATTESKKFVKTGLPRSRLNRLVGIVEISSGCLSSCTFCQVKLVKGTVFSYPEDDIVRDARTLVSQGAKEIWLTSTDNAAYGKDSKTTLSKLIRKISSIPGDFKIRIGMMNPLLTKRRLEDLIASFDSDKVFKFVHLPVQSGSDRILKSMQRGYTVQDFEETVKEFRRNYPRITVSTDMIVAYPTENEEDFENSLALLRRTKPDVVNISRFGARQGTKAATMSEQIDSTISKNRSTKMTELTRTIQRSVNSKWIGWKGLVLIDEIVKNAVVGRNYAYKPCLFQGLNQSSSEYLFGQTVEVEIDDATSSTLHVKKEE